MTAGMCGSSTFQAGILVGEEIETEVCLGKEWANYVKGQIRHKRLLQMWKSAILV